MPTAQELEVPESKWRTTIVATGFEQAEQLLANPRNFRVHSKFQQDSMRGILDRFGWLQMVIVNRVTGHVLDGHMRINLAMETNEPVPVAYVELSEEKEREALAVFDAVGQLAGIDKEVLAELHKDLDLGEEAESVKALLQRVSDSEGLDLLGKTNENSRGLGQPVISYNIVFATAEQQDVFFKFVKYCKATYPNRETVGERIAECITEHNLTLEANG